MKIIEVRDGFIVFEAGKDVCLSSFVKIDGAEKSYIAQISQLKFFGDISIVNAKILFIYKDNKLTNYDNTLPDKNSQIESFTENIISNSIPSKKPIIIGKTIENNNNIVIDYSAFDKKMLMSIDSPNLHNLLVRNFSKQFKNLNLNTIILDTLGVIKSKKYVAGIDFKLPLNTDSLSFIYDSCLSDATSDSKSTIIEIFKELSEYSKTVPFVPFETLKTIVDDMVDNKHIFKLLVLKNKLSKFEKLGYFATKKKEVEIIENILSEDCVVIDFSKLDTPFLNKYLTFIYEKIQDKENTHVILETANTVSKQNLKLALSKSKIPTTIITHSKFQYLNDMKNLFDNFIIEPSLTNKKIFEIYSAFLEPTKTSMYLSAGEALNYIPLLSNAQIIDETIEYNPNPDIQKDIPVSSDELSTKNNSELEIDAETTEEEESINEDTLLDDLQESDENPNQELNNTTETETFTDVDVDTEDILAENDNALIEAETVITEDENNDNDDTIEDETQLEILEQELGDDESSIIEDIQEHTDKVPSMNQEEIYSAIDEKSETVLSSVAKNFNTNEKINLFDEDGEIIEDTDSSENIHENIEEEPVILDNNNDEENSLAIEDLEKSDKDFSYDESEEQIIEDDLEINSLDVPDDLNNEEDLVISTEDLENESSLVEETEIELDNEDIKSQEDVQSDDTEEIEIDADVDDLINSNDIIPEESSIENTLDTDLSEETKVLPIDNDEFSQDLDEIVELNPDEASEEDIIVDMSDDDSLESIDEDTEKQLMEDVDKVYTTPAKTETLEDISDTDLDLIDELNSEDNELEILEEDSLLEETSLEEEQTEKEEENDYGLLEDFGENQTETIQEYDDSNEILEKRASNTPIVPVYDADIPQEDMVTSDPIQQGDAVTHAKYGNGVVEKMIKYGSKTLFAINFENLGRRLLDPTLTEIKRI